MLNLSVLPFRKHLIVQARDSEISVYIYFCPISLEIRYESGRETGYADLSLTFGCVCAGARRKKISK